MRTAQAAHPANAATIAIARAVRQEAMSEPEASRDRLRSAPLFLIGRLEEVEDDRRPERDSSDRKRDGASRRERLRGVGRVLPFSGADGTGTVRVDGVL